MEELVRREVVYAMVGEKKDDTVVSRVDMVKWRRRDQIRDRRRRVLAHRERQRALSVLPEVNVNVQNL